MHLNSLGINSYDIDHIAILPELLCCSVFMGTIIQCGVQINISLLLFG